MTNSARNAVWRPVWPWCLAVAIMAGTLAFWFLQLQVDAEIPAVDVSRPPVWRVLDTAAPEHAEWWERTQIWLPTLFALPETRGFSEPVQERGIAVRPPVDEPPAMAMSLDTRPSAFSADVAVLQPQADQYAWRVKQVVDSAGATPSRRIQPDGVPDMGTPRITEISSLPERHLERAIWPDAPQGWGDESWVADGFLYIDANGVVTHVMLELRPHSSVMNQQVSRALHQWRWQPADAQSVVHLGLSYRKVSDPQEERHDR